MIVTLLQPTFLPWVGYFEMIARSQAFVVFDHVQFEKKSWQSRNRILGPNGAQLLSVPVKTAGRQYQRIDEVEIDYSTDWVKKHLITIGSFYKKAPYQGWVMPNLIKLMATRPRLLAELNVLLIISLATALGCHTKLHSSAQLNIQPDLNREEEIIAICKAVGGTTLLDAAGAAAILRPEPFKEAGINVVYQKYEHPTYPQVGGKEFVSHMSVLDLLMNCGEESGSIMLSGGR